MNGQEHPRQTGRHEEESEEPRGRLGSSTMPIPPFHGSLLLLEKVKFLGLELIRAIIPQTQQALCWAVWSLLVTRTIPALLLGEL